MAKLKSKNLFLVLIVLIIPGLLLPFSTASIDRGARKFIYSTLFGGSENEIIYDVEVDSEGNLIIAGCTTSPDFPVLNAFQSEYGGGIDDINYQGDGFIAKISPSNTILWASYIGGSDLDCLFNLYVDPDENIYVIGQTTSTNMPVTENAYQQNYGGGESDGFLAKISSDGDLLYSTYIGGNKQDIFYKLELDQQGAIYLVGETNSPNFNTTVNAPQSSLNGSEDVIIFKFSHDFSEIPLISYWGSIKRDTSWNLCLDSTDNIIIAGITLGSDFPVKNAFQSVYGGNIIGDWTTGDIFVTKFDPDFNVTFSTFLGGTDDDSCGEMSLDSDDNIVISGISESDNYPVLEANQTDFGGRQDGILTVLAPDGQSLEYSSYYGGVLSDLFTNHLVTGEGKIVAVGRANKGFPTVKALQEEDVGYGNHLLITQLSSDYELEFGSQFGNCDFTLPLGIAYTSEDEIIIVGYTTSDEIYLSSKTIKGSLEGEADGFLIKMNIDGYLSGDSGQSVGLISSIFYTLSFFAVAVTLVRRRYKNRSQ